MAWNPMFRRQIILLYSKTSDYDSWNWVLLVHTDAKGRPKKGSISQLATKRLKKDLSPHERATNLNVSSTFTEENESLLIEPATNPASITTLNGMDRKEDGILKSELHFSKNVSESSKGTGHDEESVNLMQKETLKLPSIPQNGPKSTDELTASHVQTGFRSKTFFDLEHTDPPTQLVRSSSKPHNDLKFVHAESDQSVEQESFQSIQNDYRREISTEIDGAEDLAQWKAQSTTLATSRFLPKTVTTQFESERKARVMRLIESQKLPPIANCSVQIPGMHQSRIRPSKQYGIHSSSGLSQKYGKFLHSTHMEINR
jgi:hypothetical protein